MSAPDPLLIDLTQFNQVVDYQPDDLTVTVEPGVTLQALDTLLSNRHLTLPLDPPHPATSTLGGIVATAATGPLVTRWGSPRRHLIGITVMDGKGVEHHAGGRVVKNVAGLDLMKLHCGAWGTLGVITEMTFRLQPRPAESITLAGRAATGQALASLTLELSRSELTPAIFEAERGPSGWSLRIRFDGFPEDNAFETARAIALGRAAGIELLESAAPGSDRSQSDTTITGHLRSLPTRLIGLLDSMPGLESAHLIAHPLAGRAEWSRPIEPGAPIRGQVAAWRALLGASDRLLVEVAGGAPVDHETLWGPEPPHFELMRRLKATFDPERRFNPGRYFWGL